MTESKPKTSVILLKHSFHEGDAVNGVAEFAGIGEGGSWLIEVSAIEKVEWTETVSFAVQGFTQTYIEDLHGKTDITSASVVIHQPIDVFSGSRYRVPFSFTLPTKIPGSCSHINYLVRARISSKGGDDSVSSAPFKVIQGAPLSSRLQVKTDSTIRVFLCCKQGHLASRFVLDRSWYAPGDVINLSTKAKNSTKGEIVGVSVALKSVERFVSDRRIQKDTEHLIIKEHFDKLDGTISFAIPSNLQQSILGISYRFIYVLDIHVELSRGSSPTLRLPLVILPARADEAPADHPIPESEGIETPHVTLVLSGPYDPAFKVSEFKNVSEFSELGRSSSRLSRSWSNIKSLVRVGSKFITGRH